VLSFACLKKFCNAFNRESMSAISSLVPPPPPELPLCAPHPRTSAHTIPTANKFTVSAQGLGGTHKPLSSESRSSRSRTVARGLGRPALFFAVGGLPAPRRPPADRLDTSERSVSEPEPPPPRCRADSDGYGRQWLGFKRTLGQPAVQACSKQPMAAHVGIAEAAHVVTPNYYSCMEYNGGVPRSLGADGGFPNTCPATPRSPWDGSTGTTHNYIGRSQSTSRP
jgi:hypothetical protein